MAPNVDVTGDYVELCRVSDLSNLAARPFRLAPTAGQQLIGRSSQLTPPWTFARATE